MTPAGDRPDLVRLAHVSDVHVTADPIGWQTADYFSKRYTGWLNFRWLGRAHRFRQTDTVLAALRDELARQRPDRVVFSGDATALGFEAEFARAADLLGVGKPDGLPGLAVPGNHDYYTRAVEASGLFERYFAPWQQGERVDQHVYPFAQRVGHVWLVAVNSATGNRWSWDASGAVDAGQLARLKRLLVQLGPGPRLLVTHYPVCVAGGRRERRSHGLRNLAEVVAVAAEGGVSLWLHGHRHGAYQLVPTGPAPFPVICTGSTTQTGLWSYGAYTIEGLHFHAVRRRFEPEASGTGQFRDAGTFDFPLRDAAATRSSS
jgi:3',5'-cyclic AMP phosphodiesterase CpdA